MYYYEKDYIMRLIHGVAQVLARLLLGKEMESKGELIFFRDVKTGKRYDELRKMIDAGEVNAAEDLLFDLLETECRDDREMAALVIAFYDYLNDKDDAFLAEADFSREEILRGMEDALKTAGMEIPEYLRME